MDNGVSLHQPNISILDNSRSVSTGVEENNKSLFDLGFPVTVTFIRMLLS